MAVVALRYPGRDDVLELFAEHWERHPAERRLSQIPTDPEIHQLPSESGQKEVTPRMDQSQGSLRSSTCGARSGRILEGTPSSPERGGPSSSPALQDSSSTPETECTGIINASYDPSFSIERPHAQDDFPLTDDLLTLIFMSLPPNDLSQAGQVCRKWREVATSPVLHSLCFRKTWGLDRVEGIPSRLSFWRLDFPPFVLRHQLRASDSVTSVAVQHGCLPASIRRTNNMMSDHAIHSRTQLLIPVSPDVIRNTQQQASTAHPAPPPAPSDSVSQVKAWLRGKRCCVEFDTFAKRDVAVVLEESRGRDEEQDGSDDASSVSAQQNEAKRADARAKVVRLLMRAFGVDEPTASFYLEQADGDVRVASQEMRNDLSWESSRRTGARF